MEALENISHSLPQIDSRFLGRPTRGLVPRMSETPELCHSKSLLSVDLLKCNAPIKVKAAAKLQVLICIRVVGCVFKSCSRQILFCNFIQWQGGFGAVEALRYTVSSIFKCVSLPLYCYKAIYEYVNVVCITRTFA